MATDGREHYVVCKRKTRGMTIMCFCRQHSGNTLVLEVKRVHRRVADDQWRMMLSFAPGVPADVDGGLVVRCSVYVQFQHECQARDGGHA